ncbi:AMP-binding protein [Actinoplanes sp. NPDC000266]
MNWIDHHAARDPGRVALIDLHRGHHTSYGELAARIRSLAWSLKHEYGVQAGDRVAILSHNDTRVFESIYACGVVGAIAVPLNWRLTPAELAGIRADARPAVLLHEGDPMGLDVPVTIGWDDSYESAATAAVPADWEPEPVDPDAVWTIIYTSGTTGQPKGVQATHRGVLASMLGILVAHGVTAESRCLTVLPTFHVAGLNLFANPVLYAGGTVLVARMFDPAQTLRLLAEITHFCGVPANYQFVQQLPGFADTPLRPFTAAVGGSPVPSALVENWAQRGIRLTTVYGITEAGACVTTMPPGRELSHNGTIGLPTLYARCRIRTADDEPATVGETGELQISGPLVTSGYWGKHDATAAAFTADGWLRTGDAAMIGEDGHLVLVDRWKDMYISGGENVYPAEVENVLYTHAAVAQTAVVGVPDDRWGETGVAFVVRAVGAAVTADELTAWCRGRLAGFKVPSRIRFVDELPRNATGKVLKAPLRADAC